MKSSKQTLLGIMVCQNRKHLFYEKDYIKRLYTIGKENNIDVFVFYPDSIDWTKRKTRGFQYNPYTNCFEAQTFPIPSFIYDRCFYTTAKEYRTYLPYVKRIRQEQIPFLGKGLSGKWKVYQILSTNPIYKSHLPKTSIYRDKNQLLLWLSANPIILKPIGGSHGKGVIKVCIQKNSFEVVGRTYLNQKFHLILKNKKDFYNWIQSFTRGKRYLVQQYLNLTTSHNQPYDIRVLVQKNENGQWETTGMAARIGDAKNITSNLHGGGRVDSAIHLIQKEFSPYKAKEILEQIHSFAKTIPPFIEQSHGSLFELGLDLGIDKQGKVWIIEVNSKPGRSVFSILGEEQAIRKSLSQPILYTKYLAKKQLLGGNVQ
ncbi:YheC/YheD family protein [Tepidibacillus fermentans]|uniref:YheC/D-like protein n=1 Tax=Tepidibacillus fermentans TaxID=1281767 RepID=A0A4R3KJ74_9BACI|nr:YheC/YheD family protein [Tepidibacillus fermentans]TCS83596.1 YheC/D-like protein [Tepidibacillus fermentans]